MLDDRPGGGERVASDAEHHRVAGTDNSARVGEHVRSALEDEPDDTEWSAAGLDRPGTVVETVEQLVATTRRVTPTTQAAHHVGTHLLVEDEPGGGAASRDSCDDVGAVRLRDRREPLVIGEGIGELLEEVADLLVAHRSKAGKRTAGVGHGVTHQLIDRRWDHEQRAGGLHDDQPVAFTESLGEVSGHHRETIASEWDLLALRQACERSYLGLR